MNKAKFTNYIKKIVDLKKKVDKIFDAFKELENCNFISFGWHEDLMIKLLAEAIGDEGEWISYWIYELDFGKKAKRNSVSIEGKNIPIKTISNLYDLITKYEKL